jgi:TAT-translocated FGD2 family F420-dependent dehydrogenase
MAKRGNGAAGAGLSRRGLVGFQLAGEQFEPTELLKIGVACEKAGFDVVTFSDHLQPWQANEGHATLAWITMAALGQLTQRITVGTTVTCPSFRYNPAVVAEAFASLSSLYPGRIFLGLGSGEAINEEAATGLWPRWSERSERLIEASQVIRQLWGGREVDHQGKHYRVRARLYDPPRGTVPLLMAANGPKAMRRAGQYADGLVTDPETWKQYKQEFFDGAKAAGKDPAQMPVYVEKLVVVGDRKEAERAAELWRFIPKAWTDFVNVPDPRTIQERADREVPLDDAMAGITYGTDPEVHRAALAALFASGATEVHIHSGQPDQMRVVDFYGAEVLPRLRRSP